MRVSAPIKSLVHGMTTLPEATAPNEYLAQQTNMQTIVGLGVRRRPSTVAIRSALYSTDNDRYFATNSDFIKSFSTNGKHYFLKVRPALGRPAQPSDITLFDTEGNETLVTYTQSDYDYIADSNLQIAPQADTIFLNNPNKKVIKDPVTVTTDKTTLVNVAVAPNTGITLSVTVNIDSTTTQTATHTVLATDGVDSIANNLASNINLIDPTITATALGATIAIVSSTQDTVLTTVSDDTVLKVISNRIDNIAILPAQAIENKVVTIGTPDQSDSTLGYVIAKKSASAPDRILAGEFTAGETNVITNLSTTTTGLVNADYQAALALPSTLGKASPPGIQYKTNWILSALYFKSVGLLGTSTDTLTVAWAKQPTLATTQHITRITVVKKDDQTVILDVPVGTITLSSSTTVKSHVDIVTANGSPVHIIHDESGTITTSTENPFISGTEYQVYLNMLGSYEVNTGSLVPVEWEETGSPEAQHTLLNSSLPHAMLLSDTAQIQANLWQTRNAGNDKNNPMPAFVNDYISSLNILQGRLIATTRDTIVTTQTQDNTNWFKQSAFRDVATDPVSIFSTAKDNTPFEYSFTFNNDLVLTTRTGMFTLSGKVPLTPSTAALPKINSFSTYSVPPVTSGNNLYFLSEAASYLNPMQLQQSSLDQLQNVANRLGEHIKGMITKNTKFLLSNETLGTLLAITDKEIYVCDFDGEDPKTEKVRLAWSVWNNLLGNNVDYVIEDATMKSNYLYLAISSNLTVGIYQLDLSQDVNLVKPYLDNQVKLHVTSSATVQLPTGYIVQGDGSLASTGTRAVHDTTSPTPMLQEEFIVYAIVDGVQSISFPNITSVTDIVLGTPSSSEVMPKKLYGKDTQGFLNTATKLRISQYHVTLQNSAAVTALTSSKWNATVSTQSYSGLAADASGTYFDTAPTNSGNFNISFKFKGEEGKLQLQNSSHYPMDILSIDWTGNYTTSGRRF